MTYSIIGILASLVLIISNRDILFNFKKKGSSKSQISYRLFLYGVLGYYITDLLWGILESNKLVVPLFIDTTIHFAVMIGTVVLWTLYAVNYLESKNVVSKILKYTSYVFFVLAILALIVNCFVPIFFEIDSDCNYKANVTRYITLIIQIIMLLLTSIYSFIVSIKTKGRIKTRHLTIGVFGLAMMIFIIIQVFFPLYPFYAMGYMLGTCLLHTYVVEDEKEEYREELERVLERERLQMEEITKNREALKNALDEAKYANQAKTAFLSNMSHEIRTPMNAIIGLNNIAMNDPSASDKVKGYLEKIGESAQHLLGIINDILDMSRIESGKMVIKKEEFSFAKALEQVNTMVSGQCRDKNINYDCHIEGHIDDYYIGDVMKIKQIMLNILGNSVKFTPEGGSISFKIEEGVKFDNKATLKFIFTDNGIGMSKDYLPHLFEAFSQEDSSSTSKYGSTGLGMPITKSIVELMNGSIEVHSVKNEGTTFKVTITLEESKRKSLPNEDDGINPHDLKVLIIDDDIVALEHAEIVLGKIGVSCETAESGWEGIDKVRIQHGRQEDYNLILIDWKMPEMDGIETTRNIRSIVGNDTPIIILTSFNWDEIVDEAKEAGVDTFVPKPLFAGSVMDEFKEAFRRKKENLADTKVSLKNKKILLAEDVAINARIMEMVLSMKDVEVEIAENGKIAVEMYETMPDSYYDAILMDIRMPIMDGLEATKNIRNSNRSDSKTIPIIALTANAFDEDVQRSMQAGMNAHLSKPIDPDLLFETLGKLLK